MPRINNHRSCAISYTKTFICEVVQIQQNEVNKKNLYLNTITTPESFESIVQPLIKPIWGLKSPNLVKPEDATTHSSRIPSYLLFFPIVIDLASPV